VEASFESLSENLRARLEPPVRVLFSRNFVVCCEWFDRFTTEVAGRDLRRLGLDEQFEEPRTPEEALARLGYSARAAVSLRWMLEKLTDEGFVQAERSPTATRFRRLLPLPSDPSESKQRALAIDPSCSPGFTAVETLSESIVEYFRGEKSGEDILFSPARLSLWFDYFNNANLLYAVNNTLGAEATVRVLPSTRPAVVLELGGGAGSAALALLERLDREGELARIGKYVFTEPVPTFLRRGERALKQRLPSVALTAQKLDMNLPLAKQGIVPESIDLVYAVNTIHVARDLPVTLGEVFRALRPGGHAVFSECIRPTAGQPIYVEFIFNFLENFVNVQLDPEIRPTHGFLTPQNWRAALTRAGFTGVQLIPDVEALTKDFPHFFVAAITANRPG
jgi:SAM-dependent methyltransferase